MWGRRTVLVTVIGTLALLWASPASAAPVQQWAEPGKPLIATDADGLQRAWAYGSWQVVATDNGTRSVADGKVAQPSAGAHNGSYFRLETYVNSGICFQPEYTSCDSQYYYFEAAESTRVSTKEYPRRWLTVTTALSPGASYARAAMQACEDRKYRPDPCSSPLFTRGNDY